MAVFCWNCFVIYSIPLTKVGAHFILITFSANDGGCMVNCLSVMHNYMYRYTDDVSPSTVL
jgi:hypothetical protein